MFECKKVAAVNDISGIGRCSMTVIIPSLSAMGIQVCPVPTAVLSAHTGFDEYVFRDLTDYIKPALGHYIKIKYKFDCVYTGFLSSEEQVDYCLEFFDSFNGSLKVCDPVMGDGGKTYPTYTKKMCERMIELVRKADVITPNLTEAAILLGEEYQPVAMTSSEIKSWLVRLSEIGPNVVVITSVSLSGSGLCNVGYDKEHSTFWKVMCDYVPAHYSGCGDMFASVLVGGLLKGDSLPIAINRATAFTELAIKTTFSYSAEPSDGIMLESCLNWLINTQIFKDYETL